jgi:hypothetical protein
LNSTVVIILITIALLVLAIIAFLIIRRQGYVRALRGRGWTLTPDLLWTAVGRIRVLRPSQLAVDRPRRPR